MDFNTVDIINYLQGEMVDADKTAFELELSKNDNLKEQLEICKNLIMFETELINNKDGIEKLQSVISEIHPQYFKTAESKSEQSAKVVNLFNWKRAILSAAAVLLLAVVGIQYFKSQSLLNKYGHLDIVGQTERGESDNQLLELAKKLKAHKYSDALPLAKDLILIDSTKLLTQLYYGTALLHNKQYVESRHWLIKIADGDSIYKYKSHLLIALSYLQEKDIVNSKIWLEKIPESAPEHSEVAKILKSKF